jgi:uncharacterized protein YgiM (DUF1202 family)
MNRRSWTVLVLLLVAAASVRAQIPEEHDATTQPTSAPAAGDTASPTHAETGGYGIVTKDKVRVRGGAGDTYAEVMLLDRGDIVQIVGEKGAWTEVLVPGGFVCFVRKGAADRAYVEVKKTGEGTVIVDGLQVRPKASLEAAAIGKLELGSRVMVLGEEGEWLKILAPDAETLFIYTELLTKDGDQEAMARDFELRAADRRGELLRQGEVTRAALDRKALLGALDERLTKADDQFIAALKEDERVAPLETVAGEYARIAADAPPETPIKKRAEEKSALAKQEAARARDLNMIGKRMAEIDDQQKKIEAKYAGDLQKHRDEMNARDRSLPKEHFLFNGMGEMRVDVVTELGSMPVYTLVKGGRRQYFLVSDRYDLGDYRGKTVGVSEWVIEEKDSLELRTVHVTRLEILD